MRLRIVCRHTAMHREESVRVSIVTAGFYSSENATGTEERSGWKEKICKIECPGKFWIPCQYPEWNAENLAYAQ